MKTLNPLAVVLGVVALSGCGFEGIVSNLGRSDFDRPASRIVGTVSGIPGWTAPEATQFTAIDGEGNDLQPFARSAKGSGYEVRLPSSNYSMIRVQATAGNMLLRAVVPSVGQESTVTVDLSPKEVTALLITEARFSALGKKFQQITPAAWAGERQKIEAAFASAGPAKTLLDMVAAVMAQGNPTAGSALAFGLPRLCAVGATVCTPWSVLDDPLDATSLAVSPFDYTGDQVADDTPAPFNAALVAAAQAFKPEGCPSSTQLRLVFTVDFNAGALDGNCASANRFKWATDKPGKRMFFVGFVHEESEDQRGALNNLLGGGVPNQIEMYDDGTNGDETSGDNVWTKAFDVTLQPGQKLRVGYKYTWGTRGAQWSGSEEWPGNSRLLEVVDLNGDGFVYRRDVFGDEATNKDKSNLNFQCRVPTCDPAGTVTWNTELHGATCGAEAKERRFIERTACTCANDWFEPTALGPITEACP